MSPDDPRHGRKAGYEAGCRLQCCRDGAARYEKSRQLDLMRGRPRTVPVIGARRRIQALQRLGWSAQYLSERLGYSRAWLTVTVGPKASGRIYARSHDAIATLYEELSMQLGPSTITRARAEKAGWLPPLAYDDGQIDDPDFTPVTRRDKSRIREYDEAVVLRILGGEELEATPSEKAEVIARWVAGGGSERDICNRMGWRHSRYRRQEAS